MEKIENDKLINYIIIVSLFNNIKWNIIIFWKINKLYYLFLFIINNIFYYKFYSFIFIKKNKEIEFIK